MSVVLDTISQQGAFHFSYLKEFIHDDSLVTINVYKKPVRYVLDMLFQGYFQYKEVGNQVIIQQVNTTKEKWYAISGQVKDAVTGQPVYNASVYEGAQLMSTMTNEQGYFRLRLREKERVNVVLVTVSKDLYKDTAMIIAGGHDQEMIAMLKPAPPIMLSVVDVNQRSHVEQTLLGGFFLSSKQRMQSLNLSEFFTKQPYQYSIIPAVGTHGKLGSQVINKVSVNMIGGYTAGLNGVEFAGIFNIDQKAVQYVQLAGLFNVVGGHMKGLQAAGIHNHVMDSLNGVQLTGFSNIVKYGFRGVQAAGGYNKAGDTSHGIQIAGGLNLHTGFMHGVQIAGYGNISHSNVNGLQIAGGFNYRKYSGRGVQLAGLVNLSEDTITGMQVSGMLNYAKVLKGVQIGLINVSDSSDGYSIGIVNIVRKGYHQLLVYNNEFMDLNLAYKSGNRKIYSVMVAGMNLRSKEKAFTYGYGIGHVFHSSGKEDITAELTTHLIFLGNWDATQGLVRLQPAWNRRLANKMTFFAGPTISLYFSDPDDVPIAGYKSRFPGPYGSFTINKSLSAWFGWHVGFSFF
jgi:hypothetical protein